MVIQGMKGLKEIITDNLNTPTKKDDILDIVGVGVEVVAKMPNAKRPFFYTYAKRYLDYKELNSWIGEWHKEHEHMDRYIVATKGNANKLIDRFKEEAKSGFITVLESDGCTKKLINPSLIQEVQTYVFDPQADGFRRNK